MSRLLSYRWIIILFVWPCCVTGQVNQPDRIEFTIEDKPGFSVTNAREEGLFVFRQVKNAYNNTNHLWEVYQVDTALNIQWRREYQLAADYGHLGQYYANGKLFLLFRNNKPKKNDLELVSFNISSGAMSSHSIRNFIPFAFQGFKIIDNSLIIGGYFNYRPLVVLYSLYDHIPRVLPGFFNEKAQLIEMKVNDNGTFDIMLKGTTPDKKNTLFINTFNPQGRLVKKISLNPDKTKGLLFGRSEMLEGGTQLVAGVYGHRRRTEYSRGVFVANINEYGEQNIKYYNYGELKNFFSYMKAKRERRVLRRIERKKIKNKKLRFNYRLLVHDLIKNGDQYVLLGEAFYPKYKSVSGNTGLFNSTWTVNRGIYQSSLVFDGYNYTHAVVLGFNKKGDLLWDNSFEIKDVISFELEQFVHVHATDEKLVLLYVYNDAIRSKIIYGNEVIEGREKTDIRLLHDGDQMGEGGTHIGGLDKWYDRVFFTYGTQIVRNEGTSGVQLKRRVFFVNKVVFE